jgi:hypothetical protein
MSSATNEPGASRHISINTSWPQFLQSCWSIAEPTADGVMVWARTPSNFVKQRTSCFMTECGRNRKVDDPSGGCIGTWQAVIQMNVSQAHMEIKRGTSSAPGYVAEISNGLV